MKNNIILGLLICIATLTSCKDDTTTETNYKFNNDTELIKSVINKVIEPNTKEFTLAAKELNNLISNYEKNTTIENLVQVKQQWGITSQKYAFIFAFNIGAIKDKYLRLRLYNWPSTNNAIEDFIKNKEVTNINIKNFGSSAKGIAGIEYLIFSESNEITNKKMLENVKRRSFLQLISQELFENANLQENLWKTYGNELVNKQGEGISNPFNILFNGLNNVVHYATETKVGKPAGLLKSKHVNVEILQAFFSKSSLHIIEKNIESIQNVFFNDEIVSISDKIEFITKNKTLNNKLQQQFDAIFKAIKAINTPLKTSLTNEKENVKNLYEELKKLEILLTVDVRSSLSLIITGTDGDGD